MYLVLNLVINGWPSILTKGIEISEGIYGVLNLVINGWPSIHVVLSLLKYYFDVLNLVINGWPSIPFITKYNSI